MPETSDRLSGSRARTSAPRSVTTNAFRCASKDRKPYINFETTKNAPRAGGRAGGRGGGRVVHENGEGGGRESAVLAPAKKLAAAARDGA